MSREDVEVVRRGCDVFNRGDYAPVLEALDPSIVWEEPEPSGVALIVS